MAPTNPTVTSFNALPRPTSIQPRHPPSSSAPSSPSPNHWHISLHTPPITPPGDLLFLLQPATGYLHIIGPATPPVSSLPSASARAEKIAPLILDAFCEGLGGYALAPGSGAEGKKREMVFAPGSWSAGDAELADALGKEFKRLKVRKECRVVGTGDAAEEKKVRAEWEAFVRKLETIGLH